MKIYTKTGDDGTTGLYRQGRVPKSHELIVVIGEVDELNAAIGLVCAQPISSEVGERLLEIQNRLFDLGADLASLDPNSIESETGGGQTKDARCNGGDEPADVGSSRIGSSRISQDDIGRLEEWIDEWTAQIAPLKHFILPGGSVSAAHMHLARTICRRVERHLVRLMRCETAHASLRVSCVYVNRLSDLMFVAARKINHDQQVAEPRWEQRS